MRGTRWIAFKSLFKSVFVSKIFRIKPRRQIDRKRNVLEYF